MKYLLILSCLLFTSVGWSKDVNWNDLIISNQDGLYYEKFKDVPFTGDVVGAKRGIIIKGKREGEWLIYHNNGQLEEDVNFKDGKKEGEYLRYSKNGKLYHKGNYKNDKIDGEYLTYYQNGQLKRTEIYKDGELIKTINH